MTEPQSALEISLNGESITLSNESLREALREIGCDPEQQGIAVAINMSVVPRSEWSETNIRNGDRVDIVGAKQGG